MSRNVQIFRSGAGTFRNPMPIRENLYPFVDPNGNPVSPIRYRTDDANGERFNGVTKVPYNIQARLIAPTCAPSLHGTAGGPPLPNDWENTVWQDIGLIPIRPGHYSPKINKPNPDYNDRSTWRDCWLEQAILEAMREEKPSHNCCRNLCKPSPRIPGPARRVCKQIYPNNLKSWELGKEAPQNFCPERVTIACRQGTSEDENLEVKPTLPKTNSSSCLGI
jgi:hypothetical protein